MPGPPPTPIRLRLLRGNPSKRPIRQEPQPSVPAEVPEPPPFLIGYALDEWYCIAEELYRLKLLTIVDINTLAAYCAAYARWRTAEEAIARMAEKDLLTNGLMIKTRAGDAVENPLVGTAHRAATAMVRYAAEFGLTPSARSRISTTDAIGAVAKKFDGLLAG